MCFVLQGETALSRSEERKRWQAQQEQEEVLCKISVLLGGRCAEKIIYDYENEYFIKITSDNKYPNLKSVRGTNNLIMGVFEDYNKENIIIISCIDNLIKGASGQAIQNMNIMFDFSEHESLSLNNLFP